MYPVNQTSASLGASVAIPSDFLPIPSDFMAIPSDFMAIIVMHAVVMGIAVVINHKP